MENDLKQRILNIIRMAEEAAKTNLNPEKPDEMGYAYVAGYSQSALSNIREIVEAA